MKHSSVAAKYIYMYAYCLGVFIQVLTGLVVLNIRVLLHVLYTYTVTYTRTLHPHVHVHFKYIKQKMLLGHSFNTRYHFSSFIRWVKTSKNRKKYFFAWPTCFYTEICEVVLNIICQKKNIYAQEGNLRVKALCNLHESPCFDVNRIQKSTCSFVLKYTR